ncbi:hypothetical protein RCL_jg10547.t1 [Rhizophagus clarus]|uniref:Uncharacterized protein n=1 Tax=Rhizophagus clarus TaxID=94130 RepID=A0A8H3QK31_9GLOM|nr:hypothetical protein RCL_jg10547.t1 [Rhizophagus clarus]
MDDELLKSFLGQNKDVMQIIELLEYIQPRPRSPLLSSFIATLLGRFAKNFRYHDWKICIANLKTQTPKEAEEIQQQQQMLDDNPFIIPSGQLPEILRAKEVDWIFRNIDQASKCINTLQLWNDVSLLWCCYSPPKLRFKKYPPVRFDNTGNTSRYFKPISHQDTNSQFSGNCRFYN